VAQKNVKKDLPVRDYKLTPRFGDLTFLRTAASVTLDALGLSTIARNIEQAGVTQAVDVSAWRACWHCGSPSGRIERPNGPFRRRSRIAGMSQTRFGGLFTSFRAAKID